MCLGHQVLCHRARARRWPTRTSSSRAPSHRSAIDGRTERVGFYNTFVARVAPTGLPDGVAVEADPETGDIHLVRGPHYRGIQFHAESILTEHGYDLLHDLVLDLVR